MSYVIVFVAMFGLDFVWSYYTRAITNHKALSAALWSVALILFNGAVTHGYVNNLWLLIPAGLGAFAGTYVSVRWRKDTHSG